jgi:hypothetical protein
MCVEGPQHCCPQVRGPPNRATAVVGGRLLSRAINCLNMLSTTKGQLGTLGLHGEMMTEARRVAFIAAPTVF